MWTDSKVVVDDKMLARTDPPGCGEFLGQKKAELHAVTTRFRFCTAAVMSLFVMEFPGCVIDQVLFVLPRVTM